MNTAFRKYTLTVMLTLAVVLLPVLGVNMLVDPLWYLDGNSLFGRNFPYNERYSKTNLFLKDPLSYDCIVFGSSRTTLLDARQIKNHTCFNYSFSRATHEEYSAFARFVKAQGVRPLLVVVGVDNYNFTDGDFPSSIPSFVQELEQAPRMLASYLSYSSLKFSLLTLSRKLENERYYDADFRCRVIADAGPFKPAKTVRTRTLDRFLPLADVNPDNAVLLAELRQIFPQARFIGYIPPINAYYVANLKLLGLLESHLATMYQVAGIFDEFYDFTIPSPITRDTSNTYDGHHYYPEINDLVAATLSGDAPVFGLSVHQLSERDYRSQYQAEVNRFIAQEGVSLVQQSNNSQRNGEVGG